MQEFFEKPMGMGRYPEKSIAAVFSDDRQYFDQILYKNMKFRHEYATAFQDWAAAQGIGRETRHLLLPQRIEVGIMYTGEDKIKELFSRLVQIVRTEYPTSTIADDLDYKDTLPGGDFDTDAANAGPVERFRRFWSRVALAEVWEE